MRPAGCLHSSSIPANLSTTVSWGYSGITFSPKPSRLPLSKTSSVTVWEGKSLRYTCCKVEVCCMRTRHKLQILMSLLMFGTCSNGYWQWFMPVKVIMWALKWQLSSEGKLNNLKTRRDSLLWRDCLCGSLEQRSQIQTTWCFSIWASWTVTTNTHVLWPYILPT